MEVLRLLFTRIALADVLRSGRSGAQRETAYPADDSAIVSA